MLSLPRLYPILDTQTLKRRGLDPVEVAEAFLEGGVGILQFRHKTDWNRDVVALAERIRQLSGEAGVPFVLNDRADYAAMLRAGLHVGQEDLAPKDARAVVGTAAIIGLSTHNEAQMIAARTEPVDYVAFGPVFETATKQDPDPTTGLERLRMVRAHTERPLVAIGGITRESAPQVFNAGADSVAVISDLLPVSFPLSACKRSVRERLDEWHRTIKL